MYTEATDIVWGETHAVGRHSRPNPARLAPSLSVLIALHVPCCCGAMLPAHVVRWPTTPQRAYPGVPEPVQVRAGAGVPWWLMKRAEQRT